jgi:hypothetical protein
VCVTAPPEVLGRARARGVFLASATEKAEAIADPPGVSRGRRLIQTPSQTQWNSSGYGSSPTDGRQQCEQPGCRTSWLLPRALDLVDIECGGGGRYEQKASPTSRPGSLLRSNRSAVRERRASYHNGAWRDILSLVHSASDRQLPWAFRGNPGSRRFIPTWAWGVFCRGNPFSKRTSCPSHDGTTRRAPTLVSRLWFAARACARHFLASATQRPSLPTAWPLR